MDLDEKLLWTALILAVVAFLLVGSVTYLSLKERDWKIAYCRTPIPLRYTGKDTIVSYCFETTEEEANRLVKEAGQEWNYWDLRGMTGEEILKFYEKYEDMLYQQLGITHGYVYTINEFKEA